MTVDEIKKHIEDKNKTSPLQTYLKEIVYGGNDGIVTTFAVVAGFAGADNTNTVLPVLSVLIFGFANLFADGLSMGLGNFLSLRSEKDVYKKELKAELKTIRNNPVFERRVTEQLLILKGFSTDQARTLTDIYAQNEKYWLSFMMNYELELPNPSSENPFWTGLATLLAFVFFGFIPLIPYLLFQSNTNRFMLSSMSAFGALILLGLLRWKITRESLLRSVGEIILIGSIAALAAYSVGSLFRF